MIEEKDARVFSVSVAPGGTVSADEAGHLAAPAPYGMDQETMPASRAHLTPDPLLLTGAEALRQLPVPPELVDTTGKFIEEAYKELMVALPLNPEDSLRRILNTAQLAITERIAPGNNVGFVLVGNADVSEWLTNRLEAGMPRRVTNLDEYLKRISGQPV